MTHKERFIKTLKREKLGGQVPAFELAFYLTMEAFGKIHPNHRKYNQWNQMSYSEQKLHVNEIAQLLIDVVKRYDTCSIFINPNPFNFENTQWLLETIREKSGDEYYICMHGDPTLAIPDGDHMMDMSVQMYEEPEVLNDASQKRMDEMLEFAQKLDAHGHLLDGFTLCSDYCFNTNPFFSGEMFDELIAPYLKGVISGYREMGYYTIKHTDGNILPIAKQMADCGPDAIQSLDPQGGVSIPKVRELIGDDVTLIGNVNCGLLQTGTEEECLADIFRSLREGMERGYGYVFSTSNCAYTGMPLERYEMMNRIWKEYGNYDRYDEVVKMAQKYEKA